MHAWHPIAHRHLASLGLAVGAGLLACIALLALLARPAWAAPAALWTFPGAAPCDTSLQACINAADPGDTIIVQPGTYITSVTLSQAVSLTGVSSATTILKALAGQRALTVTGAAIANTVVISGLTFTGGNLSDGSSCPVDCGGGVLVVGTAQPLFINVTITNNTAWSGGGLYADTGSTLRLDHSQVLSNTSLSHGGGVRAFGAATLNGSLFQGNQCTQDDCEGGGLRALGTLALTDTQFVSNASRGYGGGARAEGLATLSGSLFQGNECTQVNCFAGGLVTGSGLALTDTQFVSNTSRSHGGGAFAFNVATLSGSLFQGNGCTQDGCQGAGLFAFGTLALTDTQFVSNTSRGHGGGALAFSGATLTGGLFRGNGCTYADCSGGGLYANGTLNVEAAEFRQNVAAGSGGALSHGSGAGHITNTLFAGNTAGVAGAAVRLVSTSVSLVHSTIAGPAQVAMAAVYVSAGTVGITNTLFANHAIGLAVTGGSVFEDFNLFSSVPVTVSGGVISGGHSLSGTASLVDPASGDYHLTGASAALNAGTDAGVSVDFEGNPRPLGPGFDIGYDEQWVADVSVSKTDGQTEAHRGDILTYTLVVGNAGPHLAADVVVSDSLPADLTGTAWTCAAADGSSCPATGAGSINVPLTLTVGGSVTFTLQATIAAEASGVITNTVTLRLPSGLVDATSADLSASDVTSVSNYRLYLPLVRRD